MATMACRTWRVSFVSHKFIYWETSLSTPRTSIARGCGVYKKTSGVQTLSRSVTESVSKNDFLTKVIFALATETIFDSALYLSSTFFFSELGVDTAQNINSPTSH